MTLNYDLLTGEQIIEINVAVSDQLSVPPARVNEAALNMVLLGPESMLSSEGGLAECASAYLFQILNHTPFIIANTQTAIIATSTFLQINGYRLNIDDAALPSVIQKVLDNESGPFEVAVWIGEQMKPEPK